MMRRAQPWLGTLVDITIKDDLKPSILMNAFDEAFFAIKEIHTLMSFHETHSDIGILNAAPLGQIIKVSTHTCEVIKIALDVMEASGGIFNINCGSRLVDWDYLPAPQHYASLPISSQLGNLLIDECTIKKDVNFCIDLGGIAKGYAVDMAINILQIRGIQSACINAGGDMRVLGKSPYEVGVRYVQQPTSYSKKLTVQDEAFATSASYFSKKYINGNPVSPLVNGLTGEPLLNQFSISVRASTCVIADALTKVILSTLNTQHPILKKYNASALIS